MSEYRDKVIRKLNDCQEIVHNIESSKAWETLLKDLNAQKNIIDDNWQDVYDEKKFREARVVKMSIKYVLDYKRKYEYQLENLKEELKNIGSKWKRTGKYYDNETILETPVDNAKTKKRSK